MTVIDKANELCVENLIVFYTPFEEKCFYYSQIDGMYWEEANVKTQKVSSIKNNVEIRYSINIYNVNDKPTLFVTVISNIIIKDRVFDDVMAFVPSIKNWCDSESLCDYVNNNYT